MQLVPYRKEHVERYHSWMLKDWIRGESDCPPCLYLSADPLALGTRPSFRKHLSEATCSEPLSLEEEFDMQLHWRDDNDSEQPCHFTLLGSCPSAHNPSGAPGLCDLAFLNRSFLLFLNGD